MAWIRWLVLVAAILLVAAGCSVVGTTVALDDAGLSVHEVSVQTLDGTTTVRVVGTSPPGVPREVAVERAERVVWQTQRTRVDRLELVIDDVETSATHDQLAARFGPRDPALDGSRADLVTFVVIAGGIALLVLVVIVLGVVVGPRRRRRWRAGPPPPLWVATDLVGPRAGQFVVDYLVWGVPTFVVLNVLWFVGEATRGVPWAGYVGWGVASVAWGWFTYAYRPTRRGGQTFGMRRVGKLCVVTVDGGPAGVGRHTVRWALLVVDTVVYGLVALATMSATARHQRVGDLLAGTVVVRAVPPVLVSPPV